MDDQELKRYLWNAAKHGYADKEKERQWAKEADHSTTIRHTDGQWSMDDNFFGGEPYGGREVVFFDGKPVWMMVYYGSVAPAIANVRAVYSYLQDALANPDADLPVRGPRAFEQGSLRYEATWNGGINAFTGREAIFDGGREIYAASFVGGVVDARSEAPA
jgi:hypothetical protein